MRIVRHSVSHRCPNVRRLDCYTCDVSACVNAVQALQEPVGLLEARQFGKGYLAIIRSLSQAVRDTIESPITMDPEQPGRFRRLPEGGLVILCRLPAHLPSSCRKRSRDRLWHRER